VKNTLIIVKIKTINFKKGELNLKEEFRELWKSSHKYEESQILRAKYFVNNFKEFFVPSKLIPI
jgi:hypothetical protein